MSKDVRVCLRGVGTYLPPDVIPNNYFKEELQLDTSDDWIQTRTGIKERHFAKPEVLTSELGARAAHKALADAGMEAGEIDLIVLATTTPDHTMPSTATHIQHQLGISGCMAFDINAACSGFVYALTTANSLLSAGNGTKALVIGSETYSRIMNWQDRGTCILFGDGAGAWVLSAEKDAGAAGVLYSQCFAAGEYGHLLATDGGVSSTRTAGTLYMSGKDIFRHAVAKMSAAITDGLAACGLTIDDVSWLVPHQANQRILATIATKIGLDESKVISTVSGHANTSAASIPLASAELKAQGGMRPGEIIVVTALGAGLTWGCSVIRL